MRSPPSWFGVEAFLVSLDTFPTDVMGAIVRVERFDHVVRFAIAALATMNSVIQ
jgi:hypothetical protein